MADYFGLVRARSELYARVNERVDSMMEAGLLAEVRGLVSSGSLSRGMPEKELFTKIAVSPSLLILPVESRRGDIWILERPE